MTSQNNDSPDNISAKKERMIRDRLWQMKKAGAEILDLINQDLVSDDGEKYTDCDGACDHCFINDICMQIVDLANMDIPGDAS